jgi:hypothetical protein
MAKEVIVDITVGDKTYEDWSPQRLTFGECDAIERTFGGTMDEFGNALARGSVGALRVLVWSLLRRDKPGLKTSDLDGMAIGEVTLAYREDADPTEPAEPASDSPAGDSDSLAPSPTSSESDPATGTT